MAESEEDRVKISPPAFYTGKFKIPKNDTEPLDTFINMDGWGKVITLLIDIFFTVSVIKNRIPYLKPEKH